MSKQLLLASLFRPKELETTEEPVYDLRDNPDFKYRPGSIVIRVANFDEPGASNCGGQVLDNYSSGQIKVWWGDGRTSFVWPQDLYKVCKVALQAIYFMFISTAMNPVGPQ